MKSILCIVNPVSGLEKSLKVYYEVEKKIVNAGFFPKLFTTSYAGHATEYVSTLKPNEFDRVLVFGGDGTVNETVNGLYQADLLTHFPLGIIPTGSGNSVMHDIDCLDYHDAIDRALENNIQLMDVNKVIFDDGVRLSISIIGWGMFSYGNLLAEKLRFLGTIRYDVASIIKLLQRSFYDAKMTINNTTFDISCAFIVGCNSMHTGKGMKAAPNGGFFDGVIDILIVKNDVNRFQLINLFSKVFSGEHVQLPYVHIEKAKSFTIDALGESLFNLDGDLVKSSKISTEVIPKAIKLLV